MEDDLSLFDPLQSDDKLLQPATTIKDDTLKIIPEKIETNVQQPIDKTVVYEDLLGGFSQEVNVDEVDSDNRDRIRSTTSFFLLDFDGGADEASTKSVSHGAVASDHGANNIDDIIDDADNDSLSSTGSEIVPVDVDNLPLNDQDDTKDDQQPQSGFFFNDLLVSDKPRKISSSVAVSNDKSATAAPDTPSFIIGSEVTNHKTVAEHIEEETENNFETVSF